jgi:hypothetical protein
MVIYGCQCLCPVHQENHAPVAYLVRRGDEYLQVCTRCDLSTDLEKTPIVDLEASSEVYFEYDALGAMCLVLHLQEMGES